MALIRGGELHLLASKHFEPELVLHCVRREEITIINSAPSMFYSVLEWPTQVSSLLSPLRWVFLGGEPIAAARLMDWVQNPRCNATVVNVYGVAECADVSAAYELVDYERYAAESVPLGRPIFNTHIYLLDDENKEVAVGDVGEICIGGDGVGLGYENDPDLTEKRFIPDSLSGSTDGRIYRTGDLGRIGENWNLEYRGRIDHQVKIAGVRIELGDVEAVMRSHPHVKDVVVTAVEYQGEKSLVACVMCNSDADEAEVNRNLREYMRERLPPPMRPSGIYRVTTIPLTPNGKVDRKAVENMATGRDTPSA